MLQYNSIFGEVQLERSLDRLVVDETITAKNINVSEHVTVQGDLEVKGTTTTVNQQEITVQGPIKGFSDLVFETPGSHMKQGETDLVQVNANSLGFEVPITVSTINGQTFDTIVNSVNENGQDIDAIEADYPPNRRGNGTSKCRGPSVRCNIIGQPGGHR